MKSPFAAVIVLLATSLHISGCLNLFEPIPDSIFLCGQGLRTNRNPEYLIYFIATKSLLSGRYSQQLYSMRENGTGIKQITNNPYQQIWDAAISWDGKRIAFLSGSTEDSLFVMDHDGSNPHFLTPQAGHPVWSRDGSQLAFSREVVPDALGEYLIFTVDIKTAVEQEVPPLPRPRFVTDWSKDGGTLLTWVEDVAYDSLGSWRDYVRVATEDFFGHELKTWGEPGYIFFKPIYSTGGDKIAFISNMSIGRYQEIRIADVTGDSSYSITRNHSTYPDFEPVAWSTDDSRILANADHLIQRIGLYGSIVVIDVRSGTTTEITPFNRDSVYCWAVGWRKEVIPGRR